MCGAQCQLLLRGEGRGANRATAQYGRAWDQGSSGVLGVDSVEGQGRPPRGGDAW